MINNDELVLQQMGGLDGETLSGLKFVDDVALTTEDSLTS